MSKVESVTIGGWAWVTITCVLGFMISTSGFGLQKLVSATTFLVVNNVTKFLNILLGLLFLNDSIGFHDGGGCVIAIGAGAWYSYAQMRLQEKSKR